MARTRISPGTVGDVGLTPFGYPVGHDGEKPVVIPRSTANGSKLDYPSGAKVGASITVTVDGVLTSVYILTGWRGLARVVDIDGTSKQVRAWRPAKAAAKAATEQAGLDRLRAFAAERAAAADQVRLEELGDITTTVSDLVHRWFDSPAFDKLASKTKQDYRYASKHVLNSTLANLLPRSVSVAKVKGFLIEVAETSGHGRGAAKHAKAVLSHALNLAVDAELIGINPVLGVRNAIPDVVSKESKLDHTASLTTAEATNFLWSLARDPEAAPMGSNRRKGGPKGSHARVPNGKDIRDLTAFQFVTGTRLGEALALRWSDVSVSDLEHSTVDINGTVTYQVGVGTVRQMETKTKGSTRTIPLPRWAAAMLVRRARTFGIDLLNAPPTPVFGSPAKPDQYRDQSNLNKVIAKLYDRHGITFARSHIGRKYRATSLLQEQFPLNKIGDLLGHKELGTTLKYFGRSSVVDESTRIAMGPRRSRLAPTIGD